MQNKQEVQKVLDKFSKEVIKQARQNLTKSKKNVTKDGYNSLKSDLRVHANSFSLEFLMNEYMMYQDKGVKGSKSIYPESRESPFRFKNKQPPRAPIEKWIKNRGIKGRNKKGQFITNESLSYMIARSIFNKGIKGSMFFTRPFEQNFKKLPNEVIEAFGLEVDNFFDSTT